MVCGVYNVEGQSENFIILEQVENYIYIKGIES